MSEEATLKFTEMLEKGLEVMKKVLNQEVKVSREDMINLLNFETVVKMVIDGQKAVEGKSIEEILKMRADMEGKLKQQPAA